jgi:hypothetical protein
MGRTMVGLPTQGVPEAVANGVAAGQPSDLGKLLQATGYAAPGAPGAAQPPMTPDQIKSNLAMLGNGTPSGVPNQSVASMLDRINNAPPGSTPVSSPASASSALMGLGATPSAAPGVAPVAAAPASPPAASGATPGGLPNFPTSMPDFNAQKAAVLAKGLDPVTQGAAMRAISSAEELAKAAQAKYRGVFDQQFAAAVDAGRHGQVDIQMPAYASMVLTPQEYTD